MPQANRKMKDIEVPGTRQFANRVEEFPDAVDLTLGQPDFETPQPIKDAAIEALKHQRHVPKEMNPSFVERRDYLYQRLVDMGLEVSKPTGAFYIFPSIRKYDTDSFRFATEYR